MHSCIFITGQHILIRSAYLSCACQYGPSLGWSARWIFLPYILHRFLTQLVSAHWFIYFYQLYSNTFYIFLRWLLICVWSVQSLEGCAPFLRDLWLFDVSNIFGGGSKVVRGFYTRSRIICIVCPIRSPWGYPLLSPGLRMSDRLSCGAFVVSWLFLSSMWWQGL